MDTPGFYRPFSEETFDNSSCFLCGESCEKETAEHVFPKWLQHEFNLWNQRLKVSNGTTIQYKALTIPCCSYCNNEHLSQMEIRFKELKARGFSDLSFEDELTIFQWSAKIIYATRYKELSLQVDQSNPELGNILSPEELEGYSALHLFLQSIRIETAFNEPKPWSLFVFNCDDDEFFYHNSLPHLCFSMKLGQLCIVMVYEENNIISDFMSRFYQIGERKLNLAQYLEVGAHLFYAASLKLNVPKYLSNYNQKTKKLVVDTYGQLTSRKWDDKEFAIGYDFLLRSGGIDLGHSVLHDDGKISTFLFDEKGKSLLQ